MQLKHALIISSQSRGTSRQNSLFSYTFAANFQSKLFNCITYQLKFINTPMASHNKRKQLVNQLRKAHFPFGFEDNKAAQSQYVEKYKQYEAKLAQQKQENSRKVNITIADMNGGTDYVSQFKEKYPEHHVEGRQKISNNITEKNFVFGYDPEQYATNYKDQFNKKQANNSHSNAINQREPHIHLGDSLTDFTTTYGQIHNQKEPSKVTGGDPNLIRRSNMVLGNDRPNYETSNRAAFIPQLTQNYHVSQRPNVSNISLGSDAGGFVSENKQNYAHKESGAQPVDKDRIRDFRSAHFQFGSPSEGVNLSEAQQMYSEKPIDYKRVEGNKASSLNFNIDGKPYYETIYSNEFAGKAGEKANPIRKLGQIDNVLMGTDSNPTLYTSQAKAQFGGKNEGIQRAKPSKPVGSLDLGKGQGEYLTHNQDTYKNKFPQRQNNRLTEDEINKMKGINFTTGFQQNDYRLSSQTYGKSLGSVNKLPKQVLDSMKNTNIMEGDFNPYKGGTTYKDSYLYKQSQE